MKGVSWSRLAGLLLALILGMRCGWPAAVPAAPAAVIPTEPGEPAATAAVQKLLAEAGRLAEQQQPGAALAAAERALATAKQGADGPGEALSHAERALQLQALGRNAEARNAWQDAARAWREVGDGPGQVEARVAEAVLLRLPGPEGQRRLEEALELARAETRRPLAAAVVLQAAGGGFADQQLATAAQQCVAVATQIREKYAPGSLPLAESLQLLGYLAHARSDWEEARQCWERARVLQERLAPRSEETVIVFNNLGSLAHARGDHRGARRLFERAVALREVLTPDTAALAQVLMNVAYEAQDLGDLTAAKQTFARAQAIFERRLPASGKVAQALGDLGNVAKQQGDLARARDYSHRALALREKIKPGSMEVANSLATLGTIAKEQGDLVAAREYHERALAIEERELPGSLPVAQSLNNLGLVVQAQGDLPAAQRYFERARVLKEQLIQAQRGADALTLANTLGNLGRLAKERGDLAAAHDYYEQALTLRNRQAPGSLAVAASLNNLGELALTQGRLAAAGDCFQRATALFQKLAPNSLDFAVVLLNRGLVARRRAQPAAAEHLMALAWERVQRQATGVSGDDARQAFGTLAAAFATNLIQARVARGQADAAFTTLEEGRAQALQQLLDERGLTARLVAPALWQPYQQALEARTRAAKAVEQAARQAAPAGGDATAGGPAHPALAEAQQAYTRARVAAEARWAAIKRSAPRLFPAPLAPAQARRALPAGTLFAAFAVGSEESALFLVRAGAPVQVFRLPLPRAELEARVATVRRSISRETGTRGVVLAGRRPAPLGAAAVPVANRALFQRLFPLPARRALSRARRVVLSPDGPLWDLPFAALITNAQGAPRYLGLEKPLTYAQSLTLYARSRPSPAGAGSAAQGVLVVGNPLLESAPRAEQATDRPPGEERGPATPRPPAMPARRGAGELALLSADGAIPPPLPYAEAEAAAVARLYGTRGISGAMPTEAWLRQRAGAARVIHLATHAYFNPIRAMSSGLRLAVPARTTPGETEDDGTLQAWEIQSQLKLDAELVVLSACETGLGAKVPGEGLVGLTRALQYAGARSIVASQWPVADASTERLMVQFHRKLRAGLAKDEALRQAMRMLAGNAATAHPYYWAPFLLVGDPRNLTLGVGSIHARMAP